MNFPNAVTKGISLLVIGALAFVARKKRGRPSLFGRRIRPPSSPPAPLDPGLPDEFEREVRVLLAQGQKIEAIKYVREATNWGLKAAKDFVDAVQDNPYGASDETFSAVRTSRSASLPAEVLVEVRAFVRQGRTIEAIKRVREATDWGLKEAKDYVDTLL